MDKIEEILSLVQEEDLDNLVKEHMVDRHNTKLVGKLMFKGLIKLILKGKQVSLRMLEKVVNQGIDIDNPENVQVTFSGLSKRLKELNVEYFKGIYNHLLNASSKALKQKDRMHLHRFDSTIINLSGYLIKDWLKIGGKANDTKSHLK